MPARPADPAEETLADKLLSERVLYPLLGLILLAVTLFIVVRKPDHGPAPDLDLPVVTAGGDLGPERVRLRDLRGKVVLFDFWATWCGPCRMMTPVLVRLHHRFGPRGLAVVGVNVDESGPSVIPPFRRHFGIDYPIVYDTGSAASGRYGVEGLPTLVLIDREGKVRYRHAGVDSEADLASLIEGML